MEDQEQKFSELKIGDKTYKLVYDFNAMADAEPRSGCNILEAVSNMTSGMTAAQLRGLLFAMMSVHHPDTTLNFAGELCRKHAGPVQMAIGLAFYEVFSEEIKDLTGKKSVKKSGTTGKK